VGAPDVMTHLAAVFAVRWHQECRGDDVIGSC